VHVVNYVAVSMDVIHNHTLSKAILLAHSAKNVVYTFSLLAVFLAAQHGIVATSVHAIVHAHGIVYAHVFEALPMQHPDIMHDRISESHPVHVISKNM